MVNRIASLAALLLAPATWAQAQVLRIYVIDVDQGAATLFVSPSGRTLLVDSGRNGHGRRIRAAMQQAGVSRIDFFLVTHYHDDHFGGIDELSSAPAIPIGTAYDRGDTLFVPLAKRQQTAFRNYQAAVGHRALQLTRGQTIPLDSAMTVTCISSGGVVLGELNPPDPGDDENDMSVSLLVSFGNFRYFVGGDIETATETKIADHDLVLDVDIYQADHHGADNGSNQSFLDDMIPAVVIISNGSRVDYAHPRHTTLARMQGLSPAPVIFQTNKYLAGGPLGGDNVADSLIADLEASDDDGTILVTVDQSTASYEVAYRGLAHTFPVKRHGVSPVVIESLLPDPTGDDTRDEEVTLRNVSTAPVSLLGWVLRDASGRVWSLSGLGTLAPGQSGTARRNGMPMSLNNGGDEIVLVDAAGAEQDRFAYLSSQLGVRIQTSH